MTRPWGGRTTLRLALDSLSPLMFSFSLSCSLLLTRYMPFPWFMPVGLQIQVSPSGNKNPSVVRSDCLINSASHFKITESLLARKYPFFWQLGQFLHTCRAPSTGRPSNLVSTENISTGQDQGSSPSPPPMWRAKWSTQSHSLPVKKNNNKIK